MDMIKITVKDGQKPTEEQRAEIRNATTLPIHYTSDCPASTPEALAEFAEKARELRRTTKRIKPSVTIRISLDTLETYKRLGKGYTGIMADVLSYAVNHPEILTQATQ